MSGLGDLFGEAEVRAVSAAGGARLSGEPLGDVHGRVRRAHARRAALRTGLAGLAVVVVGAGVIYGLGLRGAPPISATTSPSPSASPSITPSTSPSPSDTDAAWPGFTGGLTVDPHVPNALPISRGVWASAGPGWAVISYREAWTKDDVDDRGPQVVYLVSPEGQRYELVNVPGDTVAVLAWEAGATSVPVSVQPDGDPPHAGMLNLVTGEVTATEGYAPYLWSLAFLDSDGGPIYTGNEATSAYVRIASDGTQSEYSFPDVGNSGELAYNKLSFPGIDCGVPAPYDSQSELVLCWDNRYSVGDDAGIAAKDAHFVIARSWPSEQRLEVLFDSTYAAGTAQMPTRVGDFVVAGSGAIGRDGCPNQFSILADGEASPVPGWSTDLHPSGSDFLEFGATGNTVVWGVTSGCSSPISPVVVVSSDLAESTGAVLMPYPADRPRGESPVQSVTGVAVAR